MMHNMYSPIPPHKKIAIIDKSTTESDSNHARYSGDWSGPENQISLESQYWWGSQVSEVAVDKKSNIEEHELATEYWHFI